MSALLSIVYSMIAVAIFYKFYNWFFKRSRKQSFQTAPKILSSNDEKLIKQYTEILNNCIGDIDSNSTYKQQSNAISKLLKTNTLTVDDLFINNTHNLFVAHREVGAQYEGGISVRITVQYNLFGGCVANLGNDKQIEMLRGIFNRGELGCFVLTEKGAGVLSGLIVETTCKWTEKGFILNSPTIKSHKTWISQGMTAKWGVIIATLILKDNTNKGPHAFIVDMETKGIIKEDMISKTDFNGLDNANIYFNHCLIPLNSMLSKISYIDENGEYILKNKDIPFKFITVAQRLLSGRICIAGASLMQLQIVLNDVIKYCQNKQIPSGKNKFIKLSELPSIRDEINGIKHCLYVYKTFSIMNEDNFINTKNGLISTKIVNDIACGKTEIVEYCINKILALKLKVGSYCLQSNSSFGSKNDILYAYRFAEGDSLILKQKLARDCLKIINKNIMNLIILFIKIPIYYLYYLLNIDYISRLKYKLNINLLYLTFSMIRLNKEKQIEKWFQSYTIIELIARIKANILIYNAVYPKLKNTEQLNSFKSLVLDVL